MSNGINSQRKKFREALIYCLSEQDIQDHIKTLTNISTNIEEKTANRLKAIQIIFDYSVGKPKQDIYIKDESDDDDKITGYTFKVVSNTTKDIDHYYLNYDEYNEAIQKGEITKDTKVIIGDYQKAIETDKENERMKKEHNLE